MFEAPANFDTIEGALQFIKNELQAKIDHNNQTSLVVEKTAVQTELLVAQEKELRAQCDHLTKTITELEQKREIVRQEVREHAKKTTNRLEKERVEFETVRTKRREELESLQQELEHHKIMLNQRESDLLAREQGLADDKLELESHYKAVADHQNTFDQQQLAIDKAKIEQSRKIEQDEANIAKKLAGIEDQEQQATIYQKKAQELVLASSQKMTTIERIDAQLKEREIRLNLREAALRELDKVLTGRRIQLDDRTMTLASHEM